MAGSGRPHPRCQGGSSIAPKLTHLDAAGNAQMVDVGDKPVTRRKAVAVATVTMAAATGALIRDGGVAKGDVFAVARLAGIMAAKRTGDLIPLCHPLGLDAVTVDLALADDDTAVTVTASAQVTGRTGVEMEAMTAASVAALTIYDMCKAVDRAMIVTGVRLLHKSGGRSGTYDAPSP